MVGSGGGGATGWSFKWEQGVGEISGPGYRRCEWRLWQGQRRNDIGSGIRMDRGKRPFYHDEATMSV